MKFLVKLLLFASFFSCHKKQVKIHPTVEDISESVYASGVVKSKNQYQVFSTVNGIIKEVFVTEGENVKKGTPLMRIFDKPSLLNTKNAKLAAEYATLSANAEKLTELKMVVDVAKSKLKNDSLLLQRQQNLWQQNIGTKLELEQKELNYKNSLSNYESAVVRHNDLKRQLSLNARQTQNSYEINSTLTDEYTIKSEVNGKVYNILREQGELVNAQSPVAIIGDDKTFLLELQVDEYDIASVKENQPLFVNMDSYKGQVFKAVVRKINPIMNERTKSFTVECEFKTQPPVLYPFLTIEANIVIRQKKNALTIPRNYLIDDSSVMTDNNLMKKVSIGLKDYQKVEILSGLTANDYILKPED